LQPQLANLLLQREFMAPHDWPKDPRSAAELWRAQASLASASGALLLIRFLGRSLDLAYALGLMRSGPAFCQLPLDDPSGNVPPDRQAEDLVGQIDISDFLIVEIAHGELHYEASPCAPLSAAGGSRKAAGNGRSAGGLRLTASLIST